MINRGETSKSKLKAILFDLDGTLIDTYQTILQSMQYAIQSVLQSEIPPEVLMKKVGQPLLVQVADFSEDVHQREEIMRAYREHNAKIHDQTTKSFPGCTEALDRLLEAGLVLGVVTSKMHKPACEGLALFGLEKKMSCVIGADDCDKHKPDPEPVIKAMQLLGLSKDECVYVGDSPFDIASGNSAGLTTIAALWGMFSPEILKAQNPHYCASTITECCELILTRS